MDPVIEIRNLSKTFRYIHNGPGSIKQKLTSLLLPGQSEEARAFKLLHDINFTVNKGEIVGIKGRNGCGKTTLLKIIMGALLPDPGSVVITRGKKLKLSLGMGFDKNLTGRDNIYLNASILGLTFEEISRNFDEIVAFAEVDKFVDTPLRFYSNGMKSRLAFSVAIKANADILLFDEFFGSVGDESFKEKSNRKFKEFVRDGKTILLVSHSNKKINQHCDRLLLIEDGTIAKENLLKHKNKKKWTN